MGKSNAAMKEYIGKKERFADSTIQQYISNYKINLIDVGKVEDVEKFRTDLQIVFGMLQCRGNTEMLVDYVSKNEEFFGCIDRETFRALREFLHSENKLKKILVDVENKGEEKVDMCKALDDLYKMGEEKGYERGYEQGKHEIIAKMINKGCAVETIADLLGEEMEEICRYIESE